MKVVDNIIIEMTETEAYERYLKSGYDDLYDFYEYIDKVEAAGCKITDKERDEKCFQNTK